jgi:N-methylhydantoinase B
VGPGGERLLIQPAADMMQRLRTEPYPVTEDELREWGELRLPEVAPHRVPIPEGWIATDFSYCGGGYGDPLDREPWRVAQGVREGLTTRRNAEAVYGVVLDGRGNPDEEATRLKRDQIRAERLRGETDDRPAHPEPFDRLRAGLVEGPPTAGDDGRLQDWEPVLRFHEYLDLVRSGTEFGIRCRRCRTLLCRGDENYKAHAIRRERKLEELTGRSLPTGEAYRGVYQEYYCPGCATQLAVDVWCPEMGGSEPVWDIRLDLAQFR